MCCTPTVRWLIVLTLPPPLSLSSQPASRLLHPRSGLERSDFVPWPISEVGTPHIEVRLKRVAMLNPAVKAADMRIGGDPTYAIMFEEMKRLGYVEGVNMFLKRREFVGL